MNYYAGIDVSLESSSVCIVDATGEIVKEARVESHPQALVKFFKAFASRPVRCRNGSMPASPRRGS